MKDMPSAEARQLIAEISHFLLPGSEVKKTSGSNLTAEFILGACFMADHLLRSYPAFITHEDAKSAINYIAFEAQKIIKGR